MKCCSSSKRKVSPEINIVSGPEHEAKKLIAVGDKMAREIVVSHFKVLFTRKRQRDVGPGHFEL